MGKQTAFLYTLVVSTVAFILSVEHMLFKPLKKAVQRPVACPGRLSSHLWNFACMTRCIPFTCLFPSTLQVCWAYAIYAQANGAATLSLTDDNLVPGQATPIITAGQVVSPPAGASWTTPGLELLNTTAAECASCETYLVSGSCFCVWLAFSHSFSLLHMGHLLSRPQGILGMPLPSCTPSLGWVSSFFLSHGSSSATITRLRPLLGHSQIGQNLAMCSARLCPATPISTTSGPAVLSEGQAWRIVVCRSASSGLCSADGSMCAPESGDLAPPHQSCGTDKGVPTPSQYVNTATVNATSSQPCSNDGPLCAITVTDPAKACPVAPNVSTTTVSTPSL